MTNNLVIIGTGPFAELAVLYFEEFTEKQVVACACHDRFRSADTIFGKPLVALESLASEFPASDVQTFVAIGYRRMNKVRQMVYQDLTDLGYGCASFVHPSVKIWPSTTLGDNVFIFEDNTIQPFTSIGKNTILWSGNHIGHHSRIGEHCFISSHVVVSGSCAIGNNVFAGVNACLHDGLCIADECLIGAGAIVTRDTNPREVFVPVSTKPFHKTSDQLEF